MVTGARLAATSLEHAGGFLLAIFGDQALDAIDRHGVAHAPHAIDRLDTA
jgi:hypothetical protein